MKIVFWGTRGSLPAPISSEEIQAKINAVVMKIRSGDLKNADSRQRFLSSLPKSLYGTVGGNTPCVQVISKDGNEIIFDAGTGIRSLSAKAPIPENKKYSIFLSHMHWDHIQGFPFFDPIYNPEVTLDIYSPFPEMAECLARQMRPPFFPVEFSSVKQRMNFFVISPGTEFEVGGLTVNCCKMSHPGASYAYSIKEGQNKFVYATDIELYIENHLHDKIVSDVFYNAQVAAIDSQYTLGEAMDKINWGHSPFAYTVDFAAEMGIKSLYLFHHDPSHTDQKLRDILQAAKRYSKYIASAHVKVGLAMDGLEIDL